MKRCIGLLGLVVLAAHGQALACGDKFLVVGRGTRFQTRAESARALSVLVYSPPASSIAAALRDIPVERVLRRAGHAPAFAASERELSGFLRDGGTDVVVADVSDARALGEMSQGPPGPVVLPVLVNPSPTELAAARRTWRVVLRAPVSRASLLDAVDEAVERHRGSSDLAAGSR